MYSDSEDEFDTPLNSWCSDKARSKEILNEKNVILSDEEQEFYSTFQRCISDLKKKTYDTIMYSKDVAPSNLKPLNTYLVRLSELETELTDVIEDSDITVRTPQFIDIISQFRQFPETSPLKMYILDYLHLSFHCFPYSQNNKTLQMD
jgi:hypothetical protein